MKNSEFVTKWVVDTVQKQYADDIALVLSHSTLRIDEQEPAISYFVPITQKGRNFAQTFILNGEGLDIWGIPWERLERFAELEEYNITVLADAEILWARSEEDRQRFEALQAKQKALLQDPEKKAYMALLSLNIAKQFYLKIAFEGERSGVWAAYILDYLARAIAFANGSYFKYSQANQLAELAQMERVPEHFAEQYQQIILETGTEQRDKLCHQLISIVQEFLEEPQTKAAERNFQDLADWYGELSYTWLRIRIYAEAQDIKRCYMWGAFLQAELDQVCGDFGLETMELMADFDPNNLSAFAEKANELEQNVRHIIRKNGGVIREYSFEDFPYEV